MEFQIGLLICSHKDMRNRNLPPVPINLNHRIDVDIFKDHKLVPPIAVGMQMWVLLNRFAQTINEKSGK